MSLPERVDLLVAGAGTAGAALAQLAAARGLRVLCLDRRPLDEAGARWVNGVPREAFVEAQVREPAPPERRADDHAAFHLVAGEGPERVTMRDHGVLDVDMRLLVERLQREAREAGATLVGEVAIEGLEGARVTTGAGEVRAEWVVDATGEAGARLLDQPATPPADLCAAAQNAYRVTDLDAARAFFESRGAVPGDTLCSTGIAGGYSILNAKLHGEELDVLAGSIPAAGHRSGRRIIDDFVAGEPWIGEAIFGGQRVIPLGRPRDELARGRVALIGDAARQVFSAHGSGIGAGMIAARMLAEELADGGGPEAYAVRWQREHGGLFAAYDLFRRFSETLDVAALERMIRAGLIDEATAGAGLAQRLPAVPLRGLGARLRSLASEPRLAAAIGGVGARMASMMALYARYPAQPAARGRWSRWVARAAGEHPREA